MHDETVDRILKPKLGAAILELQVEGMNPIVVMASVLDADHGAMMTGLENADYPQAQLFQEEMRELILIAWDGRGGDARRGLIRTMKELTTSLRAVVDLTAPCRIDDYSILRQLPPPTYRCLEHGAGSRDEPCPVTAARELLAALADAL